MSTKTTRPAANVPLLATLPMDSDAAAANAYRSSTQRQTAAHALAAAQTLTTDAATSPAFSLGITTLPAESAMFNATLLKEKSAAMATALILNSLLLTVGDVTETALKRTSTAAMGAASASMQMRLPVAIAATPATQLLDSDAAAWSVWIP
jgi:hypothetical protein